MRSFLMILGLPRWVVTLVMFAMFLFLAIGFLMHIILDQYLGDTGGSGHIGDDWFRQSLLGVGDPIQQRKQQRKQRHPHPLLNNREVHDLLASRTAARRTFETQYPPSDRQRIKDYVSTLKTHTYLPHLPDMQDPYDIYNCPSVPPTNYPFAWNVLDVLHNWNPDNTTRPEKIYQGICVFDWDKDETTARRYRQAELPFIVQNQPDLMQTAERWNRDEYTNNYLLQLFGNEEEHKTEYSSNNHFMYWKMKGKRNMPKGWEKPTEIISTTYPFWLDIARALEGDTSSTNHTEHEHWYFRFNAEPSGNHKFMYDELPFFEPKEKPSFFMVDPNQQRGINCRFGMKGVIAENHFDSSRNFIVLLGGERRYVLSHPRECRNMQLYPVEHPSGRHSAVDWSNPDLDTYPNFAKARVNEVVLQAGDALYLPTHWFHYIVSLNVNYQCNARSGTTNNYGNLIKQCGFS